MTRYVTRPRSEAWEEYDRMATARDVIIEEFEPRFSGLYDATGQKLYRVSERVPLGFRLTPEKA